MAGTTTASAHSSSAWSKKLTTKLSSLTESSSKESHQTVAKWISFNRKHAAAFVATLTASLQEASESRQAVILSVICQVLLLEQDVPIKWDRLADLRLQLGESLLEIAHDIKNPDNLNALLQEWDDNNVFGGPTLIHQIRRKIASNNNSTTISSSAPTPSAEKKEESTTKKEPVAVDSKKSVTTLKEKKPTLNDTKQKVPTSPGLAAEESKPSPPAAAITEVTYDFENKGIPAKTVDPKDFLEPCRAIATLQIARDLRNDNAVQLSSLLQSLPEDIRAVVATAAETGTVPELEEPQLRDFSLRTSEQLIDMDLPEQLQNVRTFRDVVTKQRAAREQLIELLVQSRCEFGANEAAAAFEQADRSKKALQKRVQALQDAMELEGLEVEEDANASSTVNQDEGKDDEDELQPLTWYQSDDANKRQKVE